jgi:predicted MPP superfamily phosphohydrolase
VHIRKRCEWLDQLCQALENESPDLVAITGDIVTKGWTKEAVLQFLDALPAAPLGRAAVMGNWEHWSGADLETWQGICHSRDVELLNNRWIQRDDLVIAGTDDWLSGSPDLDASLEDAPSDLPVLALTHSPGLFPEISKRRVHLVLSGHSHGGQVRIPFLGALWVPRGTEDLVAGWYQENDAHLFVSRGVGWSIAPIRLWCPPELATIEMVPL